MEAEGAAQSELTTPVEEPPPTSELALDFPSSQVFGDAAAEMMHEVYANPPDVAASSSSPGQSCGKSETNMELLPDSPVSIAALFENTVGEETHTSEEETRAFEEGTRVFEEGTHAFEEETHTFEEGTHTFEGETHAFEEATHTFEEETHVVDGETNAANLRSLLFDTEKVTEEELTEAAVRCSISSEEYDVNSTRPPVSVSSEEESLVPNPLTGSNNNVSHNVNRVFSPRIIHNSSDEVTCSKRISVVKSTLIRKRRRSVSASGIGAMLLKVVRVPESGTIVTGRALMESQETVSRARKYAMEDTAHMMLMPNHSAPVVCETESEDAVSAILSTFEFCT